MKQLASRHWVQDVEKSLLVRLEQEELAPEAFGRCRLFERVIIGEYIEKMKVKLDDLGFEVIRPELLSQRALHAGRTVLKIETLTSFLPEHQAVLKDRGGQVQFIEGCNVRLRRRAKWKTKEN